MRYEVIKVKPDELEVDIVKQLSFWANPDLLKVYSKRENLPLFYLCVIKNTRVIATMPFFEKKKMGITYVYQLRMHFYTPIDFFIREEASLFYLHNERIWILQSLAHYLKKKYLIAEMKIECTTSDMRGFLWSGFTAEPLYTYKKVITEYNRSELPKISRRQLKKANENSLRVTEHWDINIIKKLLSELVKRKQLSEVLTSNNYLDFYEVLNDLGYCSNIVVFNDNEPVAFRLVLTDPKKVYSCELIAGASSNGNDLRANFLCLDYIFKLLHEYYIFDFCGANIESIAYFKSQFNCELINYYKIKKKYLT